MTATKTTGSRPPNLRDCTPQEWIRARVLIADAGHETPCWLWQFSKSEDGYGRTFFGHGGSRKHEKTHRLSYRFFVGPIPDGLEIDHLCRVKSCCNPSHLEPVTKTENRRRALPFISFPTADGRPCPNGHAMEGDNLRINNRGERYCRQCNTERGRRNRAEARQPA